MTVSLAALFRIKLQIGCLGFGGPADQIALMHRVFVDERKWIDEGAFSMLAFCMLRRDQRSSSQPTVAGACAAEQRTDRRLMFVLPGALIVLALSWFYEPRRSAARCCGLRWHYARLSRSSLKRC